MTSSNFPERLDMFQRKVNAQFAGDTNGDYVMAEDVNELQDAILAIEKTLGVNPQGSNLNVNERMTLLEGLSALKAPPVLVYLGNPGSINGSTTIDQAIEEFLKYDYVVLGNASEDSTDEDHQDTIQIIQGVRNSRNVRFYGYIDCGVSTVNLSVSEIQVKIQSWKDMGAAGIYCGHFGFEYEVSRDRQNAILDSIHEQGMLAVLQAANPDEVFSDVYHETLNPNWIPPHIHEGDTYHFEKFVIDTATTNKYIDITTVMATLDKLHGYRDSLGVRIFATPQIRTNVAESDAQAYFEYAHAVALIGAVDAFYPSVEGYGASINKSLNYDISPILGDWYVKHPNITHSNGLYSRETGFGKLLIDSVNKSYQYEGLYIPYELLRIAANSIDGTLIKDASIEDKKIKAYSGQRLIGAINADASTDTINISKIATFNYDDIDSTGTIPTDVLSANIVEAINLYAGNATIGEAKIGSLSAGKITSGTVDAERISGSVVNAINLYAQSMTTDSATIGSAAIGELTASHIEASVVEAINLYAQSMSAESAFIDEAVINSLNASKISAGDINADRMQANVVNAINTYTDSLVADKAVIKAAAIGTLTATHIQAEVINAINTTTDTAVINSAKIGVLTTDHIKASVVEAINLNATTAVIDAAKISDLSADKITAGDISVDRLKGTVVDAINIYTGAATIDQAFIGDLNASKITAGDIDAERLTSNVVGAINMYTQTMTTEDAVIGSAAIGTLTSDHIKGSVVEAINLSAETAVIENAKIDALTADHIKGSVIDAVNLSTATAVIDQGKIGELDADKITTGDIVAERMVTNAIKAINLDASTATIDAAQIGSLTADNIQAEVIKAINASIETATIDAAKVGSLTADNIKAEIIQAINASIEEAVIDSAQIGTLTADHIKGTVVEAINLNATTSTIGEAKIGDLSASKITTGDIAAERMTTNAIAAINANITTATIDAAQIGSLTADNIQAEVVKAINASVETATIDSAKIGSLTADNIQAEVVKAINLSTETATIDSAKVGVLTSDHIKSSVVEAINLNATTAVIDEGKIGDLDASKITAGDIAAERMTTNAIKAINADVSTATIDAAQIGSLTADNIQAEVIKAINASIETAVIDSAQIGTLAADHIKSVVLSAIELSTETATIDEAKIGDLSASKITSGDIDTARMTANAIAAVNADISTATIDEAHIGNLTATKITAGDIAADRMKANAVTAINASIDTVDATHATIDSGAIGVLTADHIQASVISAINASVETATIDNAKIGVLTTDHIDTVVIQAINLSTETATIDQGKIGNLDAEKITAGDISADRMQTNAVTAINASIDTIDATHATIDSAAVGVLTSDHIKGSVVEAINLNATTAVIDAGKIGELTAGNIQAEVIQAINASIETATIESAKISALTTDHIKSSVVEAINLNATTAVIDSGKIGTLTSDHIKSSVVEAINLNATTATIDSAKIGVITADNLSADLIQASHISGDDATITRILAGEITGTDIQPLQIDAGHIKAGQINTDHISTTGLDANVITTGHLAADRIDVRSITGHHLKFDAVTSWEISSDSVAARHIQADAVSGEVIRAGSITAEHISTGGLDATSMFVYGADGETIIGGGYLRVDGMDVGVIQSDNLSQNGNFNIYSDKYGYIRNNTAGETIIGLETNEIGSHQMWAYDLVGSSKQALADAAGAWSITTDTLSSGHYRVAITVIDGNGAVVGADAFYFTVDTTQALVEATNPDDHTVISDSTPTFSGTAGPSYTIDMGVYYIKRIPVNKKPAKMAQAYDGTNHFVYTTSQGENVVSVIDMSKGEMITSVETGSEPGAIALSKDGTKLFVGNTDLSRMSEPDYMSIVNTATLEVEKQVIVGTAPTNLFVSEVNPYVYVVASRDADIYVYDLVKEDIVGVIDVGAPMGKFSYGIEFNTDESIMYVSNTLEDKIIVVDVATESVITEIETGDAPTEIVLNADDSLLYVATSGSNSLEVYETTYYTQVSSQKIGAKPLNLKIYPNPNKQGSYHLYVNCSGQNEVLIIDMDTNQLAGVLETGQNPWGILMSAKGNEFFVTNNGDNSFISFTYPEGPFIGDAYLDEQSEQGQAVYNGAAGWAPTRQDRVYDADGNLVGASAVEFHVNDTFKNQTGYAKLYGFGVGNQFAEIQQDTHSVDNHSNGLPIQINDDVCELTSHLVYKSANRHWVENQSEEVYYLDTQNDANGYPIFTSKTTWKADTVATQAVTTDYTIDHSKGEITFVESTFPGYYGIFDHLFPVSEYTIGDYYKKITFLTSEYLTKFTDMLTYYAVDSTTYTVDSAALTVTFNAESELLKAFNVTWPGIKANYLAHQDIWFSDYNASALITWERPVPAEHHMGMYVDEFIPKFVVFENSQLTPFTPAEDNINQEYKGLTYSGIKNAAINLPQSKIDVHDSSSSVAVTYEYETGTIYDLKRLVDGSSDDSTKYLQTGDGVSTVTLDLSDDASGKSAYITNGIRIVHYYAENWKYTTNVIEVSHNGVDWVTLYDASVHGVYMETADGIAIIHDADAQGPYSRIDTGQLVVPIPNQMVVRFLRNTIGGATAADDTALASPQNRWVEIENYSDWWVTTEYKYQVSQLGTDAGTRLGVSGKSATGDGTNYPSIVGDLLDDTQLDFLTEQIKDLKMFVLNGGKAFQFELPVLEKKDYSSTSTDNYDVLAQDLTANINAIIDNYNTINGKAIPAISVSHSSGALVFTSLDASTTNTLEVFVEIPATLSGAAAKTNVSDAYVEAEIDIEYTSEWHATFMKGQEMGVATVLVDEEIDGNMPEGWYPPYLILSEFATRNGYYTGQKLTPGLHRVRFKQSSGTVVFDRFRFEDFQYNGRQMLDITASNTNSSWKRYKVNPDRSRNYQGKGNQTTYGPFDSPRISPVTSLPDGSCAIKYRMIFRSEIENTGSLVEGTMYVAGTVLEKGKLSTHWRASEENDEVTTADIQTWEITKPLTTGIQTYHLANGVVNKYKLQTHIIEDFHISPFAQIAEYKLKLDHATHPHANKSVLDSISGWGVSGTSTDMARADHLHDSRYLQLSGGTITGNVAVDAGVTIDGVDVSAFKGNFDTHTGNSDIHFTATERTKLSGISTGATKTEAGASNGTISIDGTSTTVYVHPSSDGNLHVPATSTTNGGKFLKAGSIAGSLSWEGIQFTDISGTLTNTQHGSRGGGTLHSVATQSSAGFLSSADKTRIDGMEDSAINQTTADGRYLQLVGGTLTGGVTINHAVDAKITLNADTDNDTAEGGEPTLVLTQDGGIVGAEIKLNQGNAADNTLSLSPFMDYDTASPVKNYNVFIHDKKIWHEGTLDKSEFTPASHVGTGGSAHAQVTTTTDGFMIASDKSKLNGIASGAEVNQNAFGTVKITNGATVTSLSADAKQDTVGITAGSNITLSADAAGDSFSISVDSFPWGSLDGAPTSTITDIDTAVTNSHSQNTDSGTNSTTFRVGNGADKTTGGMGFMFSNDANPAYLRWSGTELQMYAAWDTTNGHTWSEVKALTFKKSDGTEVSYAGHTHDYSTLTSIPTEFNPYVASATVLGGVKEGSNISIATDGTISGAYSTVTTTTDGLMTSGDKTKLNSIEESANNYTHPSGDGNLHVPATSTTSDGMFLKAGSTAGSFSWTQIAFTDISGVITDAQHGDRSGGTLHDVATTTLNGFMSSSDKEKVNGISTGATKTASSATNGNIKIDDVEVSVYSHPSEDGNLHIPATSTTNDKKVLKAGATAGSIAWGDVDWTELTGKPATFTPPVATSSALGGVKIGANISVTTDGTISVADPYSHPTGDGNKHVPADSGASENKVLKATSTAGSPVWGSVDWTEVTSKPTTFTPSTHSHPISEVTNLQTSLDGKADEAGANTFSALNTFSKSGLAIKIQPATDPGTTAVDLFRLNKFDGTSTLISMDSDGNMHVKGNLIVDGTQTTTSSTTAEGDFSVSGNLTVSGASILGDGVDQTTVRGPLVVEGNATLGSAADDTTTVKGDLRVEGDLIPAGKYLEVGRFPVYGIAGDPQYQSDAVDTFEAIVEHYSTFDAGGASALPPVGTGAARYYKLMIVYSNTGADDSVVRILQGDQTTEIVSQVLPSVNGTVLNKARTWMSDPFSTSHIGDTIFQAKKNLNGALAIRYIEVIALDYFS